MPLIPELGKQRQADRSLGVQGQSGLSSGTARTSQRHPISRTNQINKKNSFNSMRDEVHKGIQNAC